MLLRSRNKRTRSTKRPVTTPTNLMKPKARKKPAKRAATPEQPSMELFLSPRPKPRDPRTLEGNKQRVGSSIDNLSPTQTAVFLMDELAAGNVSPLEEPDRSRNTPNASLSASLNHDKEEGGDKTTYGFIQQKPSEACLITAHTLLVLLGNINAMNKKLQILIQKMNHLMPSQDLAPLRSAFQDQGDDPLLETAFETRMEGKGGETFNSGGQRNLQLLLLPTDIVLNFPSSDACWWSNRNCIAKSLSLILKQHIRTTEIQKFFYLPSISASLDSHGNLVAVSRKRLYLSFATARTPKEIIKYRPLFESLNIYSQRVFRQTNLSAIPFKSLVPKRKFRTSSSNEQRTNRHQFSDNYPYPLLSKRVHQSPSEITNVAPNTVSDEIGKDTMLHTKKIQPNFTPAPSICDSGHRVPRNIEPITLFSDSCDSIVHSLGNKKKSPKKLMQKRCEGKQAILGNDTFFSPSLITELPPDMRPGALFKNDPHFTRLMEVLFPEEFTSVQHTITKNNFPAPIKPILNNKDWPESRRLHPEGLGSQNKNPQPANLTLEHHHFPSFSQQPMVPSACAISNSHHSTSAMSPQATEDVTKPSSPPSLPPAHSPGRMVQQPLLTKTYCGPTMSTLPSGFQPERIDDSVSLDPFSGAELPLNSLLLKPSAAAPTDHILLSDSLGKKRPTTNQKIEPASFSYPLSPSCVISNRSSKGAFQLVDALNQKTPPLDFTLTRGDAPELNTRSATSDSITSCPSPC